MLENLKQYYYRHQEQNIHALKYAIAFALGYSTVIFLNDPYSAAWVLITIAVIMTAQPIVGQHVLKSATRLIGTLVGAVFGIIAFYFLHNPILLFIFIILVAFFLARFAVNKDQDTANIAVLGMVTFSLVVFVPHTDFKFALMRVIDIFIGASIALLVSRFIFPMSSRRAFIFEALRTFDYVAQLIEKVFIEKIDRQSSPEINEIDTQIVKSITKERVIVRSGRYESLRTPALKNQCNQLIRYLRAIFHYLLFIDVALSELSENVNNDPVYCRQLLEPVMQWIINVFRSFVIEQKINSDSLDWKTFHAHVSTVKNAMQEKFSYQPPQIGAIIFALDRMPHCINKLILNWNDIQTE